MASEENIMASANEVSNAKPTYTDGTLQDAVWYMITAEGATYSKMELKYSVPKHTVYTALKAVASDVADRDASLARAISYNKKGVAAVQGLRSVWDNGGAGGDANRGKQVIKDVFSQANLTKRGRGQPKRSTSLSPATKKKKAQMYTATRKEKDRLKGGRKRTYTRQQRDAWGKTKKQGSSLMEEETETAARPSDANSN